MTAKACTNSGHGDALQVQDEFTLQLHLKAEHLGRTESGLKRYEYDTCFSPEASQEVVYSETKALIQSAFDGYNVCVFAYGQVRAAVPSQKMSPGCRHALNAHTLGNGRLGR